MLIQERLQICKTSEEKEMNDHILDIVKENELKVGDHEARVSICSSIREVFIEAGYTNCLVYPYGSTLNGVGFSDSDLDLYVDLGFSGDTVKISKILAKGTEFVNIEAIPNARVPIVKAVHFSSGINCDLSFGNKASLWNTEFIRFCCLSDPRVRPLIMVVRYWGRMHGLVGREGNVRLCNYALTMMVIAYLQQIPCPILHSVQQLLTITDVDLAPSSFSSHLLSKAHILPLLGKNTDSISDLLLGFFNHYHSFDYSSNVISIFLGRTCSREQLSAGNLFKSSNPVCVQDPFELDFNICRNMNEKALGLLKCRFYEGSKKTRKLLTSQESTSLATLFHPSPHTSPLLDCHGCNTNNPTQPPWTEGPICYTQPAKIPHYMPTIAEYNLAVLRCSVAQRMPPWWRKWRGLD
eukprot:GFUD01001066.1.p1 GENE.GFUD01001066.1~~GFUD01001066.1.p1  ORF type:complete len:409 (+),score=64.65 GFUD01001066.1:100-1326(+)